MGKDKIKKKYDFSKTMTENRTFIYEIMKKTLFRVFQIKWRPRQDSNL